MPEMKLRMAAPEDAAVILDLVKQLAEYEKALHEVVCTEADILRDGFGARPIWECVLAELDGVPVGMALFFPTWSTWTGHARLYLEDLFVTPAARGRGVGMALFRKLAEIALARQYACIDWQVLDWNEPAIEFYKNLGAEFRREWFNYRLQGDALKELAG
ncbi:GNAT family N-acetyltransferase [Acanthopleuribacter pedis]|uniref:GNAT family N-acetyltransferase n=1 Tax=Acanthopleuribacter pedis TaxID=442870 RepID=A0A8J7U444_9BACT|nr:GNAT family N-acetyltransferase [Acanthopleuribacter pedis]